jgi:hypothetical protein
MLRASARRVLLFAQVAAGAEPAVCCRRWQGIMLSDQAKSLIVACAVLVVAVCNIVFGLTWVSATGPQTRPAAAIVGTGAAPLAAGQTAPANAGVLQTDGSDAAAPTRAPIAPAAGERAQPKCDVNACAEAYRSFRASDCTYQPSGGPRRLCSKGKPPQ